MEFSDLSEKYFNINILKNIKPRYFLNAIFSANFNNNGLKIIKIKFIIDTFKLIGLQKGKLDARVAVPFLDVPERAVTPGQAAVFYQDEILLGGGWINDLPWGL